MNNDMFRLCTTNNLADSYACCLHHCGGARVCRALCRNTYIGTIPEDCVAEVACARPDFTNTACLAKRRNEYRACCMRRCRAGRWSDSGSIAASFDSLPAVPVDCVKYCDAAEEILLDKHYLV